MVDLTRAEDGLWQCLSQDKRPLALLLGAGCPVSIRVERDGVSVPLVPDIAGMTSVVAEALHGGELTDAFDSLVHGLTEDGIAHPSVEHMLTRLRTLRTVVGTDSVRGLDLEQIQQLEAAVTKEIAALVSVEIPSEPCAFDDLASWAGGTHRHVPVTIFTTNYDLLIEQALERAHVPLFDGFAGGAEPFLDVTTVEEDDLPKRWVRLWKLHGSVNWQIRDDRVVRRRPSAADDMPLIHPSHLKYDQSRRMPYLIMQDRLREFLRAPSATLVTSGYSFGDDHINDVLAQGLRSNPSAVVFGLLFGELSQYGAAVEFANVFGNVALFARDRGRLAGRVDEWAPGDDGAARSCALGDFAQFGRRLGELAGTGSAGTAPSAE